MNTYQPPYTRETYPAITSTDIAPALGMSALHRILTDEEILEADRHRIIIDMPQTD
jgi:hypothetical protein